MIHDRITPRDGERIDPETCPECLHDKDVCGCSSTSVEANTREGQMSAEDERATCEWFDSLPKPPEPLPWMEAPKATDRHPFQ